MAKARVEQEAAGSGRVDCKMAKRWSPGEVEERRPGRFLSSALRLGISGGMASSPACPASTHWGQVASVANKRAFLDPEASAIPFSVRSHFVASTEERRRGPLWSPA